MLALAKELKNPLTFIARQAEFYKSLSSEDAMGQIEQSASEALMLIDSYLLSAQTQHGQLRLSLEPIGLGSLLFDTANQINPLAKKNSYSLEIACEYNHPVMVDKRAFIASLFCLSQIFLVPHDDKKPRTLRIKAYKKRDNQVLAGVFSSFFGGLSEEELVNAINSSGYVNQSIKDSVNSGVQLAVAESLANSMQSFIRPIKSSRQRGLGLEVFKSEQLSLI